MAPKFNFEVIAQIEIVISRQGIIAAQSQLGKLTKARLSDGTEFYVREALDSRQSFYITSGERQGIKDNGAARHRQCLLLATTGNWDAIAEIVKNTDRLHRHVMSNRRFTVQIAERLMRKGSVC